MKQSADLPCREAGPGENSCSPGRAPDTVCVIEIGPRNRIGQLPVVLGAGGATDTIRFVAWIGEQDATDELQRIYPCRLCGWNRACEECHS